MISASVSKYVLDKTQESERGIMCAVNDIVSHISATQELSARTESLLREGERAYELGLELSRETDEIRRDLEGAVRACSGPDRSLCAVIDSSGIRLDLQIERVNKLYDWRSFGLTHSVVRTARNKRFDSRQHFHYDSPFYLCETMLNKYDR